MKRKGMPSGKNKLFKSLTELLVVVLLLIIAHGFGIWSGEILYENDEEIIQGIDVDEYKKILDFSFPIIGTIYNSGKTSLSFGREGSRLLSAVCGFEPGNSISLLNISSSLMKLYYVNNYEINKSKTGDYKQGKIDYGELYGETGSSNGPASSTSIEESNEYRKSPGTPLTADGKIYINNETKFKVNIEELMGEALKIKSDRKGPKVLIYHTHTTESYVPDSSQLDKSGVASWNEDPQYNVVRIGDELAQNLKKLYGIDVIHNGTRHDYPNSNGAYNRSLNTAGSILKSYPSIRVVLDIHRDGMGNEGEKLRAVSNISGRSTAQIMFVVGSPGIGLSHSGWKENLKLALKLQEKLNEISPGITKPVYISNNRYNQHISNGALIVEIGGDGNTLAEAEESTKYLSRAISEVLK